MLLLIAERVVVVTSFEPTAVVDAYAVIKILTAANPTKEVGLVINAVRDGCRYALVHCQDTTVVADTQAVVRQKMAGMDSQLGGSTLNIQVFPDQVVSQIGLITACV